MICQLKQSPVYKSIRFHSSLFYKFAEILVPLILGLTPVVAGLAVWSRLPVLFVILVLMLVGLMPLIYWRLAFETDKPPLALADWQGLGPDANIALIMGPSAIRIVRLAEFWAKRHRQPLSPYWLLHGFLRDAEGRVLFLRLGLIFRLTDLPVKQESNDRDEMEWQAVLNSAVEYAQKTGTTSLEVEDLLVGLVRGYEYFRQVLGRFELDDKAAMEVADWHKRGRQQTKKVPFWQEPVVGGVGQDWAFGYTILLQQFGLNLTRVVRAAGQHIEIFSKGSLVEAIERILARSAKNNVILVGDHGVGKKTVVYALARKILDGKVHPALRYKQVMQINVGRVLAGAQGQGEIVARIEGILREATRAGNIVLFLDDFHALVSSEQTAGTVNAAEIFLPYLQGSRVQVLATTTTENYHRDIMATSGLAALFERVDVPEPSVEEVYKILEESIPYLEEHYRVTFAFPAIKEIVNLSERYIRDKPFPQKAIDLADEVAVKVSSANQVIVMPSDVQEVVSSRSHVPVGEVGATEKDKLLKLEEVLHKRVIGQEEAVAAVANALRRARSGLADAKRPIGAFLFIGPTGVGKTETAKALAEAYYSSEDRMIRFDMSEYQDVASVYRLIGAPAAPGVTAQPGLLTTAVHDNPFSLVLLDELEKAHPHILTLFLQVFDDGRLTGSNGKVIDFTNAIIIATSNAGSEVVRQYLQSGQSDTEQLKSMLLEYLQSNNIYRPEFLNRFDAVVAFRPLNMEEIARITELMIAGLNKQLAEKGIVLQITSDGQEYLVRKGYDPVFGARPLRRVIQDKVGNALAKKMLAGDIPRGTTLTFSAQDLAMGDSEAVGVSVDSVTGGSTPS